ncbi:HD-GYP domain-containing protein [Desulfosporosinus sp. FKA]|uniref:HD-GYP domain-containing protein n=1 Tax=Desulfosporosinus sp. FKA TaxID=1969834 RepID=UPI000B499506|nr:HD-GYP domain-containing protein [Desulfosporosinus sp. FKA]
MNWLLERVQPNLTIGTTANIDLFNGFGVLLLRKGKQITEDISKLLQKREVYVWKKIDKNSTVRPKAFPKDKYTKLVGSLWGIYHEAKLIQPKQIEKTVTLVEMIFNELKQIEIYMDLEVLRMDLEKFKQNDYGTFVHSVNVALLSTITGKRLGYADKKLKDLTLGALLHDIGKLRVPKEILNKPGSLTDDEFIIMKRHPQYGVEMLRDVRLSPSITAIVGEHHERWNVKGYPYGLQGDNIHPDAQIVAVNDVYDALTADRPYRKSLPPYHALEMILAWSGRDFAPKAVQAFKESLVLYPEHAVVTLNTGEIGVVLAVPLHFPTRPLIRLLFDRNGGYINEEIYVDLMKNLTYFINHVEFDEAV